MDTTPPWVPADPEVAPLTSLAASGPKIAAEGGAAPLTGDLADPANEEAAFYRAGESPFASLTEDDRARAASIPSGVGEGASADDDTLEVCPCPEQNPPVRRFRHGRLGEPSGVWFYRDATGSLLCVVARYDLRNADGSPKLKENGKRVKEFAPWSYGRRVWTDRKGTPREVTGWHSKAPPTPRPLYGLDRLAMRPSAPVMVVEGEKPADAAGLLFPDHVAVAPMNGAHAPDKTGLDDVAGPSHGNLV